MTDWKLTKLKNKHFTMLKVLGNGQINRGIEKLITGYSPTKPEIKKIKDKLYNNK
jgi:hypothetical protein